MALKELSQLASRLRTGATIAVATASLTTCNKDGAVDPAPPPADCSEPTTTMLSASAYLDSGNKLQVTVETSYYLGGSYSNIQVTQLMNVDLVNVPATSPGSIPITLQLNPATATSGSFRVTATLTDSKSQTCSVDKTFSFTVMSSSVQISSRHISALPLDVRYPASIAMISQQGNTLELQARSGYQGDKQIEWSVSHGVIETQVGDRLHWRLPDAPGLYQVELVIDYGEGGFAIDHMTFEVASQIGGSP